MLKVIFSYFFIGKAWITIEVSDKHILIVYTPCGRTAIYVRNVTQTLPIKSFGCPLFREIKIEILESEIIDRFLSADSLIFIDHEYITFVEIKEPCPRKTLRIHLEAIGVLIPCTRRSSTSASTTWRYCST